MIGRAYCRLGGVLFIHGGAAFVRGRRSDRPRLCPAEAVAMSCVRSEVVEWVSTPAEGTEARRDAGKWTDGVEGAADELGHPLRGR
jgi:hypothetical protein